MVGGIIESLYQEISLEEQCRYFQFDQILLSSISDKMTHTCLLTYM